MTSCAITICSKPAVFLAQCDLLSNQGAQAFSTILGCVRTCEAWGCARHLKSSLAHSAVWLFSPPASAQRYALVGSLLISAGARTLIDLGCGDGKLLQHLASDSGAAAAALDSVVGVDVSATALARGMRTLEVRTENRNSNNGNETATGLRSWGQSPTVAALDNAVSVDMSATALACGMRTLDMRTPREHGAEVWQSCDCACGSSRFWHLASPATYAVGATSLVCRFRDPPANDQVQILLSTPPCRWTSG